MKTKTKPQTNKDEKTALVNPAYQKIVDRLIEMIEKGVSPWTAGFIKAADQAPHNAHSGNQYNGINYLMLSLVQWFKNYPENIWLTYRQAADLGGYVRKGEKSPIDVLFYKVVNKRTPQEEKELQDLKDRKQYTARYYELRKKQYMMARYTAVFNIAQVDGIEQDRLTKFKPAPPETFDHTPIETAEAIVKAMQNPPTIKYAGNQPAYSPRLDEIHIPGLDRYQAPENFYSTLFHELGHSTGHASRLNRPGIVDFEGRHSHAYSYEELIAEMTAAYLNAHAKIVTVDLEQNTAAYLKGWIRPLKDDPKMIVQAATEAAKAADYILNRETTPHASQDQE